VSLSRLQRQDVALCCDDAKRANGGGGVEAFSPKVGLASTPYNEAPTQDNCRLAATGGGVTANLLRFPASARRSCFRWDYAKKRKPLAQTGTRRLQQLHARAFAHERVRSSERRSLARRRACDPSRRAGSSGPAVL